MGAAVRVGDRSAREGFREFGGGGDGDGAALGAEPHRFDERAGDLCRQFEVIAADIILDYDNCGGIVDSADIARMQEVVDHFG